jgi:ABC-2 type transport system permease protein
VAKATWVELKLLTREPLTLVFTLALPVVLLFVLGGVFGNVADPDVYRGVGPMDYYVPAYVALVAASLGVVSLPVHLASYRERGVLRRFRASAVPVGAVLGAHVAVTVLLAAAGSALLVAFAALAYDVHAPTSILGVLAAFLVGVLAFAAVGMLLGLVLPTARTAQGAGVLLWFVMLILGGAGPPREVMTTTMQRVGDALPLRHTITLLQDPWLGLGWNTPATVAVLGFALGAVLLLIAPLRKAM